MQSMSMIDYQNTITEVLHNSAFTISGPSKLFTLHSGETSPYFIDAPKLFCNPICIEGVCRHWFHHIKETPDIIITPDFGGTFFAIAFQTFLRSSYCIDVPILRYTKDNKLEQLPYKDGGYRILLVEDVITSGSSLIPVIELIYLRKLGTITKAVCVLYREEGNAKSVLEDGFSIPLFYITTLQKVINYEH